MNRIPIPSFNQRISTLLFLLFCGCMEVLGMTPETLRQLPVHFATELVEGYASANKVCCSDFQAVHRAPVVYATAHPVSSSFSATLRQYVTGIKLLIRYQDRQFLCHKVRQVQQMTPAEATSIDLGKGSLATAC